MVPPPTVSGPPVTFNDPIIVVLERVDPPPTLSVPDNVSFVPEIVVTIVAPPTVNVPISVVPPPTFKLLPIPTPPFTRSAPVSVLVDCESPFTHNRLFIETSPPSSIDTTNVVSS